MNRQLLLAGVVCWMVLPLCAQDALTEAARREESEQRYRELQTRLTQVEEALQTYQRRMSALSDDVRSLREQMDRLSSGQRNGLSADELKKLQKAIEEVDRSRMEDNAKVLAQFARLHDELAGKSSARPKSATPPPVARGGTEKGYEYAIRKDDTLVRIYKALREQGIKVTQKQIEEANPEVDWKKLQIGQKIFIPAKAE